MLSGQRAFAGSDVSEVLASVLAREPDWTLLPVGMSPVLGTDESVLMIAANNRWCLVFDNLSWFGLVLP